MSKTKNEVLDMIRDGELELTETIGHVSYYMIEKTGYSFNFYATYYNDNDNLVLVEMLYDLRNKKYYIKKNGREVRFNIHNVDLVVPRYKEGYRNYSFYTTDSSVTFFNMVSVEENKGMYKQMTDVIGALGEEKIHMSSRALIRLMTEYNKLELIYKSGIDISSVKDSWFRNKVHKASVEGTTSKIHEIFDLTKPQFKFVKDTYAQYDTKPSTYFSNVCMRIKDATQQELDVYRGVIKTIDSLEEKYQIQRMDEFYNSADILEYLRVVSANRQGVNHYRHGTFWAFVTKPRNIIHNLPRLVEYLLFECYVSQGMNFRTATAQYKDYFEMSVDIGNEKFEKYPRFLKTYHDVVLQNYKLIEDEVMVKKFEEERNRFVKLEHKMSKFSVVSPKTVNDIVSEGNANAHCVQSYCKKVIEGVTTILFLRKTKELEKSLVTVEVQGDRIVQARGFANRNMECEEREALNTYAKKMKLEVVC